MIDILAIKTDGGLYVQQVTSGSYGSNASGVGHLFFDGAKPEETFHQSWVKIPSEPTKIEKERVAKQINHRFELIDPSMETDKIPASFKRDDVAKESEYDGWCWISEYAHLKSLYELKYDEVPSGMDTVEFSFDIALEISGIKEYLEFSYPIQRTEWSHQGLGTITPKDAKHQILDQILFPAIALPSKPCAFTSEQSYKIVRQHVKSHIDPKVAHITSDYDFCFTVKKLIGIVNPYETKREILNAQGKSYRKRKYRTNYVKDRDIEVFEMTYSPSNYKGYTPICAFRGKDQDDLKAVIDEYISDLMDIINAPLSDCPHCDGMGVIETK